MMFFYLRIIYVFFKEIKFLKVRKRKRFFVEELIDVWLYRNVKIVKVFVFVVIVFVLCMLLYYVIWLWYDFGGSFLSVEFGIVVIFSNIFVYLNFVFNFFIVGFIMFDFKVLIKFCEELCCCCLKWLRRSWDLE